MENQCPYCPHCKAEKPKLDWLLEKVKPGVPWEQIKNEFIEHFNVGERTFSRLKRKLGIKTYRTIDLPDYKVTYDESFPKEEK